MKTPSIFSRIIARGCAIALTWLGFSCSGSHEDMYGTPTGTFEVKGAVTTEEGTPVPDAIIRVTDPEASSGVWSMATTTSDKTGAYEVESDKTVGPIDELKVVCLSPDAAYDSDSVFVQVKYEFDKDHPKNKKDSWYIGHADLKVNFKLKPKTADK